MVVPTVARNTRASCTVCQIRVAKRREVFIFRTRGSNKEKIRGRTLDWGLLEESAGPRIRLLRNALGARSIAVSEPFALPTGSLTIMALIAANPNSSQAELAGRAGISTPSLVGIVDQLEQQELICRIRSTQDRRRNDIVLTDKGQDTLDKLFAEVTQIEAPIRDALGKDDFARFIALLDRALGALNEDGA